MGNTYLFANVTVNEWLAIIFVIWGVAVVWSVATCILTRVNRKKRKDRNTDVPGICIAGCAVCGIVGGVCTGNLIINTLRFDAGFITVLVLFIGGGIIGGTAYAVGRLIVPSKFK